MEPWFQSLAGVVTLGIVTIITQAAETHRIPPALALGLAFRESSFVATAKGKKDEIGLFQLRPATARAAGFTGPLSQLWEPSVNSYYGLKHLRAMLDTYKTIPAAVSAYQNGTPTDRNAGYTADVLLYARHFRASLFWKRVRSFVVPAAIGLAVSLFTDDEDTREHAAIGEESET